MDNTNQSPIQIAGAGPAGLATAITLAKNGRQVVVHEARPEVGERFNGDFQGLENWTTEQNVLAWLKDLGISTQFKTVACTQCIVFDDRKRKYQLNSKEPMYYTVERGPGPGTLDNALLTQAQNLGVEVRFNSHLDHLGNNAGVLAVGPKAADAIAVGYHFETDMEDGSWAICDDNVAPQGYAYLLTANGRGTVKSCMFSGFKRQKVYVQRTVDAFQQLVGLEMKNPRPHGGSGNFRVPRSAYSGHNPLVGEQAGFQDTLWGFGMRLAIMSGVLAAQSLSKNENYDVLWQRELKPQMQTSVVNRALFGLLGKYGYRWFLQHISSTQDLRSVLRRQYQPSLLKRILSPWANHLYQSRRKDTSCDHIDCHCVWCRHGCV